MNSEAVKSIQRNAGNPYKLYLGTAINLKADGEFLGTYQDKSSGEAFEVYDLKILRLRPSVTELIHASIALSPDKKTLRLYVPSFDAGQITDIGIINGVYACPGEPFVPESGQVFKAPAAVTPSGQEPINQPGLTCQPTMQSGTGYSDILGHLNFQPGKPSQRNKFV